MHEVNKVMRKSGKSSIKQRQDDIPLESENETDY